MNGLLNYWMTKRQNGKKKKNGPPIHMLVIHLTMAIIWAYFINSENSHHILFSLVRRHLSSGEVAAWGLGLIRLLVMWTNDGCVACIDASKTTADDLLKPMMKDVFYCFYSLSLFLIPAENTHKHTHTHVEAQAAGARTSAVRLVFWQTIDQSPERKWNGNGTLLPG